MTAVIFGTTTAVNVSRVTNDMMPTAETERAATRLRDLLLEIGEELGNKHGWKMEAARRTGLHQTYIAKLLSRERTTIGLQAVERVAKKMGISVDFFRAPDARSYKAFRTGVPYEAWSEFCATPDGRGMSETERTTLATIRFARHEPTVGLYLALLYALRGHLAHAEIESAARRTEAALLQMRARGRKRASHDED